MSPCTTRLAVFQGYYKDQLQSFQAFNTNTNQAFGYTYNSGDSQIRGVEWEFNFVPMDSLRFTFAGNHFDTKFAKVSSTGGVNVGDPMSYTPQYTLQLSANYGFNWSAAVPGYMDMSYSRRGKAYFIDRANPFLLADDPSSTVDVSRPLDMLQLSVGAEWEGFEFVVFGRNLLDDRDPQNASIGGVYSQARPRSFGLTVGKTF